MNAAKTNHEGHEERLPESFSEALREIPGVFPGDHEGTNGNNGSLSV